MGVGRVRRAVFFDRDGVLNDVQMRGGNPHPPASLSDLRIAAYAREAVERTRSAGFYAIAVTNQPDVARGIATRESVDAINAALASTLKLDGVYTCFHDDGDGCDCRKPKPGLLYRAAADYGFTVRGSYMVGDRVKDVECGRAAGCTTVFIDHGYAETPSNVDADAVVYSLCEAVESIALREEMRS